MNRNTLRMIQTAKHTGDRLAELVSQQLISRIDRDRVYAAVARPHVVSHCSDRGKIKRQGFPTTGAGPDDDAPRCSFLKCRIHSLRGLQLEPRQPGVSDHRFRNGHQ